MVHTRSHLAVLLVCALLSACSTASRTRFPVTEPQSPRYQVLESRPLEARSPFTRRDMSGETRCLGDADIAPAPAILLRSWLHHNLASYPASEVFELKRFQVCVLDPNVGIDADEVLAKTGGNVLAPSLIQGLGQLNRLRTVDVTVEVSAQGQLWRAEAARSFSRGLQEQEISDTIDIALRRLQASLQP